MNTSTMTASPFSPRTELPRFCGTETILLVDDDRDLLYIIQLILEASGYGVITASSADEALTRDREHAGPIAALLTDMMMPGLRGDELARRFIAARSRRQSMPPRVLYMSGYMDVNRGGALALPPHAPFLTKPFDPDDLLAILRTTLDASSPPEPDSTP